jgi:hypothetical protein
MRRSVISFGGIFRDNWKLTNKGSELTRVWVICFFEKVFIPLQPFFGFQI